MRNKKACRFAWHCWRRHWCSTPGPRATHGDLKTIGTPSAAQAQIAPSLIVLNSRGATLQGDSLVLTGITPNSIIFADRPVRAAGHQLTADIIADWGAGKDSFASDPPHATVSLSTARTAPSRTLSSS
ncbi:hypothetical protein [Bradyrhizobium sp. USDA 4504]